MATINLSGQVSPVARILLDSATSTATSDTFTGIDAINRSFQATLTGNGALSATVLIQVSNDGANWITMHTIALSGNNYATDGVASEAAWKNIRVNLSAISGTGASVTVIMGY